MNLSSLCSAALPVCFCYHDSVVYSLEMGHCDTSVIALTIWWGHVFPYEFQDCYF